MPQKPSPGASYTVCFALFFSGAAALMFETLWFRQASLAFGNSVWASALVTAAFMAGMAVGSLLSARLRGVASRRFRLYVMLELTVCLSGLALVLVLPALSRVFAPFDVAHEGAWLLTRGVRLVASFSILLLPSAAMGMTLPVAVGGLRAFGHRFDRALGVTYAANTLGAVAGAVLTERVLLAALGVKQTALAASFLSLTSAALGVWLARRSASASAPASTSDEPSAHARPNPASPRAQKRFAVAALASGFAMLGLEVVWLRMLMLFLADTPLAFAMVLTLVLFGIALGSALASALMQRFVRAPSFADLSVYAAGAGVTLGMLAFPYGLTRFYKLEQGAMDVLLIALPLVLPTAVASGCALPLVAAARAGERRDARDDGGVVLGVNTLGAAAGSAVAALVLLPQLGMAWSLVLLASVYGAAGLLLTAAHGQWKRWLAPLAFLATMLLFPIDAIEQTYIEGSVGRWMGADDDVVAVREGLTATSVHVRHREAGLSLFDQLATNSYSMSANDFAARRYMKLFAFLPLALHPGMERALVVGYGLGNTAKALTDTPELTRIDVVDTAPETFDLNRGIDFHGPSPLDDPRLTVHLEDGRHFLEGTSERYDLVTGEPPPPFLAGVESLYTAEYFQLVHDRLRDGGFATYWLPTMNISGTAARAIVAAFCSAFSDCSLWHGALDNYMLMGTRAARGPVSLERFVHQWTLPSVRDELSQLGFEHPVQLGALFIGDAPYLAEEHGAMPLTDDHPRRMQEEDRRDERLQLQQSWHDTRAARTRFESSPLVASLWPPRVRDDTRHQFEGQRLLEQLLSAPAPVRTLDVLDPLLERTPWKLPVLLMIGSNPDIQKAVSVTGSGTSALRERSLHLLAGSLAMRDFASAVAHARAVGDSNLPIAGLLAYLERRAKEKSK